MKTEKQIPSDRAKCEGFAGRMIRRASRRATFNEGPVGNLENFEGTPRTKARFGEVPALQRYYFHIRPLPMSVLLYFPASFTNKHL